MIPPEWLSAPLGSLVEMKSGFASPKRNAVSSGLVQLRPYNIGSDGELVFDQVMHIQSPRAARIDDYYLEPGDVLFCNTSSLAVVGKVALVREAMPVAYSNHITRLRAKESVALNPAWLLLCLQDLWYSGYIAAHANRWIGQAGFSPTKLSSVCVPLPEVHDQERLVKEVAAVWEAISDIREAVSDVAADAGRLVESALTDLLSPDESWKRERLGNVAEIRASLVDPRDEVYHDMPHVGVDGIVGGAGRVGDLKSVADDGVTSANFYFHAGEVLYGKIRPYLRKAALVDFDGLCSADIYPIQVTSGELLPLFLMWSLLGPTFTQYSKGHSGRARMPKVNRTTLFDFVLDLPPIDRQREILAEIERSRLAADGLERMCRRFDDLLRQLMAATAHRAVSGQPE